MKGNDAMNTIDDEAHVELLLGVHVLGGLDATDQQRVERHLGQCGRCRDEYDRLAFVAALMETVPKAELADLLLPDETRKSAPAKRARSRRFRAAPGFGPTYRKVILAAAAVALSAGVGVGAILRDGPTPRPLSISSPRPGIPVQAPTRR